MGSKYKIIKRCIIGLILFSIQFPLLAENELYVRIKPGVFLRKKPSLKSKAYCRIPFGTEVPLHSFNGPLKLILGHKGQWVKAQAQCKGYPDVVVGWVFGPFLREGYEDIILKVKGNKAIQETRKVKRIFYDKHSRLYWTQCNYGQKRIRGRCIWQSDNGMSSEGGEEYCKKLKLGRKSWRLPNVRELKTLSRFKKNFNQVFPYSEPGYYVSSTMKSSRREDYMLSVNVPAGGTTSLGLGGEGYLKCVANK